MATPVRSCSVRYLMPLSSAPPGPLPPIRAVTFDMDGLLVNSEDVYELVGAETLRRRGKPFEQDLRDAMMGRPAPDALKIMIDWHLLPDKVEDLIQESLDIFWQTAQGMLKLMPGVMELLDRVESLGLPKGVATSGGRAYAERMLSTVEIRQRFDFVLTLDDVTRGKPSPEVYLLAAQRHGVEPAQMLVFEDSGTGCTAGVAAGAYVVATPSPHTQSCKFHGAAFVAQTLRDPRIYELLASIGSAGA